MSTICIGPATEEGRLPTVPTDFKQWTRKWVGLIRPTFGHSPIIVPNLGNDSISVRAPAKEFEGMF